MDSKINTVFDGAREIRNKRIVLSEKMLSYISELSEVLIDEAGEDEIFFKDPSFISRYRSLTELEGKGNVAHFNQNDVNTVEKQLNETEKALLCLRMAEILGINGIEGSGTFFDDPPKASGETVSCVKSRLTDDAYIAFASEMSSPRVSYEHDINEVCQSVLYGKTAYGILPLSNAVALFPKYGLKTAKRVRITGQDGSVTVFALVKKDLDIPSSTSKAHFEFTLKTDHPSKILLAAEACSMTVESISYSSENQSLSVTVKISEDGFCGFLTYLSLNHPDYIPIGIFEEI